MELREFRLNTNLSDNNAKFPSFEFPKCVGYFSLSGDGDVNAAFTQLKYLSLPSKRRGLSMDLNEGLSSVIRKSDEYKGLRDMLIWIMEKKGRIDRNTTDIVCYRGLLRLIMTTPYESEGWEIMACRVNDVIYLCECETEKKKLDKLNMTEKQRKFMSWGFKFEQFVLADEPGKIPDTSQPVDEREEFCCMFTSSLGSVRLLYGAEMDGVDSKEWVNESDPHCLKNANFIEVKTNRLIENGRQRNTFERYKLIKWWCQSYLTGVQKIVCGFRDDNGVVREIQTFQTQSLHHLAKNKWRPNVCMNFCKEFLQFVQHVVEKEKDKSTNVVWRFIWNPQQPVKVVREENNEEYTFLPDWYLRSQLGKE